MCSLLYFNKTTLNDIIDSVLQIAVEMCETKPNTLDELIPELPAEIKEILLLSFDYFSAMCVNKVLDKTKVKNLLLEICDTICSLSDSSETLSYDNIEFIFGNIFDKYK